MSDIRPFLSTIPGAKTPKALGTALASVPTEPVTSWLPRTNEPGTPEIDTSSIEAEARERGYADGMAETAELRAQLSAAITAFSSARTTLVAPSADKVALAAAAVVSAWTQTATDKDLYAPIIASWIEHTSGPATVCVPPASVAMVTELLGDAEIKVTTDASMRKGDIRLSSSTRELAHSWDAKIIDLREALASALERQS
jgi:hypothetical protein